MIAESWTRLSNKKGPDKIQPHDITMIRHELAEIEYIIKGFPQNKAHIMASKMYDYTKESDEYYTKIGAYNN